MSIIACSVDGCERERYGRMEVCSMHYKRFKRNGTYDTVKVKKVCRVGGCESFVYGHGHCLKHYKRWNKYGSTDLPTRDLLKDSTCTVDGCDNPHFAKRLCSAHYTRKSRTGNPTSRYMGEIVDGKKICPRCKVDTPVEELGGKTYCKPCRSKIAVDRVKNHPDRVMIQRNANLVRRARKKGAYLEKFSRDEILERDGWVCGICCEPIDKSLKWPHRGYATIDHIIPLVRGGEHSRKNVQAAHFSCNCSKKDTILDK